MKIFYYFLMIPLLFASCSGNGGYTLTVRGEGIDSLKIVLQNRTDHTAREPEIVNPVVQTKGKAVFEGLVVAPCLSSLRLGEKNTSSFVLSNTAIEIIIDPVTGEISEIEGGYQQDMKEEYERLMNTGAKEKLYKALRSAERGTDTYSRLTDSLRALSTDDKRIQTKFIEEHPDAMMSPYALWSMYGSVGEEEAIRLLNLIDTALSRQAQYVFVAKTIRAWERTPVGSEIPDLVQNDVNGNPVSLSDFRGKYLLIDFWASWCSPCRAANPGMVELYKEYNSKGIEFLGVSLDKDAEAWKKAINDDKLGWNHVSDLRYWDNEISRYFGINSIPATILVDPEGKIVARKLHGEELEARLAELFED
jgi:thiol-disulfide isomerase/thioredoxin